MSKDKSVALLPAGPPFPLPPTAMAIAKNSRGEEVLYVAAGHVVYRLEERDGESVFVPLRVLNADKA